MGYVYVPITIGIYRGDVHLADFDCEARAEYDLPDGRASGVVDWDVTAFHFAGKHNGKPVYHEIGRTDPLFDDLYDYMDRDWIDSELRDALAADGIIDLYGTPDP